MNAVEVLQHVWMRGIRGDVKTRRLVKVLEQIEVRFERIFSSLTGPESIAAMQVLLYCQL